MKPCKILTSQGFFDSQWRKCMGIEPVPKPTHVYLSLLTLPCENSCFCFIVNGSKATKKRVKTRMKVR